MIYLQDSNIKVQSPQDVAKVCLDLLMLEDAVDRDKEHFYVLHLDTRSRVKMVELVSLGILLRFTKVGLPQARHAGSIPG